MPHRFLKHLKTVMVPLGKDGSSQGILNFLTGLLKKVPKELVEKVYLVHVVSSDVLKKASRRDLRLELLVKESQLLKQLYENYLREEARPFLNSFEEELKKEVPWLECEEVVLSGDPPKELVKFAEEKKCGTVVMSRRARSTISEVVLGSCTRALLHRSGDHTTYVVGRKFFENGVPEEPKVLVCCDGSDFAWKALEEAAGISLSWKAQKITLFHVVDFLPEVTSPEEADTLLVAAESFLKDAGIDPNTVEKKVAIGSPAEEIVSEAVAGDYDLVFVGRKGKGYLSELLLGSVSERVLHKLEAPTVAVVSKR